MVCPITYGDHKDRKKPQDENIMVCLFHRVTIITHCVCHPRTFALLPDISAEKCHPVNLPSDKCPLAPNLPRNLNPSLYQSLTLTHLYMYMVFFRVWGQVSGSRCQDTAYFSPVEVVSGELTVLVGSQREHDL